MDFILDKFWLMWAIIAMAFIIGEVFTAGFFLMWFGIGAAAAAVMAFLGFGIAWQLGTFAAVSIVLFMSTRRLADKITKEQPPGTGADRLIGKTGVVLEEIDNFKNTGKVRIDKDEWRADSATDDNIPTGERIVVTGVEGVHLIVKVHKKQ
ncbi:MAG: NfeD family protein [Deltaproteobacteria bacterium]|uniref:NfeD family protein n=1 Tax=Candidatus Zymogenus saltonus TaxID=2844893 RepID=A0A9D8KCS7_9DELT|nr:NfeD family protein [Candidatus Zymogenus saltonus]